MLTVIYLIFNEGYASSQANYIRLDLCNEAIRLARLVWQLAPEQEEAGGLLALMLLLQSRLAARQDTNGALIPLEYQDRTLWDRQRISEATQLLHQVLRRGKPGCYQLQAAIAALHYEAPSFEGTNWHEIVLIYDRLLALTPNPVIALNRLVAVSYLASAEEVLPSLEVLAPALRGYQPYYAARADMLARTGDRSAATAAYDKAIELSGSRAEQLFLRSRRDALNSSTN